MDKTRALRGLEAVFKEVEPRKPTFSPRVLDADEEEEEAAAKEEGAKERGVKEGAAKEEGAK
jgi:hypothetical protein